MTKRPTAYNILNQVRRGMAVFDSTGVFVGRVDMVHLGGLEREAPDEGKSKSAYPDVRSGADLSASYFPLSLHFRPDRMPEERARTLLLEGYVRLETDLLRGPARYLAPGRISIVTEKGVTLASSLDNLRQFPDPSHD